MQSVFQRNIIEFFLVVTSKPFTQKGFCSIIVETIHINSFAKDEAVLIKMISAKNPKQYFSQNKQAKTKQLFHVISSLNADVTLSKKLEKCHASTPLKI